MTRDVGRYHKLQWGGGKITIPKDLVKEMRLENKDKIMIEYDPAKKSITITKLN